MNTLTILYCVAFTFINVNTNTIPEDYKLEREALLNEEIYATVGANIELNNDEETANKILMRWKYQELDESYRNPQYFNLSKHYFTYKNDINKSKVYQIIRNMPKGGALHVHSTFMLHDDILVNLTYMDHLYACYVNDSLNDFYFSESTPNKSCSSEWRLVSELRNSSGDAATFDAQLKKHFTMFNDYGEEYNIVDINTVWQRFDAVYAAISPLIAYRPAREQYLYEALKQFYDDSVMYIEIRAGLKSLYELNGTVHEEKYLVDVHKSVTEKFKEIYPDFIGVKLIVTAQRSSSDDEVRDILDLTIKLKEEMPDMIAGFDLVGQEELGRPLSDFIPVLAAARGKIDFFFHAGETGWLGTTADENLYDAVLLGAKRIGHAYALMKHPAVMDAVRRNNIALEVNVISNGVLALVHDIRNHPLARYLASGLPVVISSDDPGAWSSEPLSHDFFVTFMGIASRPADLRLLKQIAMNSITYSSLDETGKEQFFKVFNRQWDLFIKILVADDYLNPVVDIPQESV